MTARAAALTRVLIGLSLAAAARATPPAGQFNSPQSDYIVSCAGCHGLHGVSNSVRVPSLSGQVGYYLNVPEGRAYLSRVPNVAFAALNDRQLAAVLNYMVFDLGGDSAPAGAKRYTAAEVAKLRKRPLTETPLFEYRRRLVDTLIDKYQAPGSMRIYGQDLYGDYR